VHGNEQETAASVTLDSRAPGGGRGGPRHPVIAYGRRCSRGGAEAVAAEFGTARLRSPPPRPSPSSVRPSRYRRGCDRLARHPPIVLFGRDARRRARPLRLAGSSALCGTRVLMGLFGTSCMFSPS